MQPQNDSTVLNSAFSNLQTRVHCFDRDNRCPFPKHSAATVEKPVYTLETRESGQDVAPRTQHTNAVKMLGLLDGRKPRCGADGNNDSCSFQSRRPARFYNPAEESSGDERLLEGDCCRGPDS